MPDSVPAEAEPITNQPAAKATHADAAAAVTTRRRRGRRVDTGTPSGHDIDSRRVRWVATIIATGPRVVHSDDLRGRPAGENP
ncbi:hypothetical protein GCM10022255_096190 [Dactylosporangium darangshiense]|uniref:Uncharacterized protein n=1 Tax=Dactylosporangium darangshiense TaxID=579108 RepID=A0ABP8DQK4_9ACTN